VLKLRRARERIRRETGRCEGNKSWLPVPEAHAEAARAAHARGLSLRAVAAELARSGFFSRSGRIYGAQSVALMIRPPG
jgi:hypothetical protein